MNIFQQANYKFTDKKIDPGSVMSIVLSVLSTLANIAQIIISFNLAGNVAMKSGMTSILCVIFCFIALGLGIRTYFKKNVYYIFAHFGNVISSVNLLFLMYIYGIGLMAI